MQPCRALLVSLRLPPIRCARGGMAVAERWLFTLFAAAIASLLLLVLCVFSSPSFSAPHKAGPEAFAASMAARGGLDDAPTFAYYISGGRGDGGRILRLLLAVYHPRNWYLLHLSADAPESERAELAAAARVAVTAARVFGNIDVLGKPNAATYMGSSVLAGTLHAASVLLRLDGSWDWFVTLSATDYPLVTQDDLFHVFSSAPRDVNFIDHTSDLGWKEYHRVQPIVVDPGIYLARRSQIFYARERRKTPESFKFFTGSPWVILSRSFLEFCIMGWDNLPRSLLLYFSNAVIPQESYFHSVICNSPDFRNTTINSDLRYMEWDTPPQMEPHFLNVTDYDKVASSGAPFARQFHKDDPILNKIDEKILGRQAHKIVPGGWCTGSGKWWTDRCSLWGDVNIIKPGPRAEKFGDFMQKLLADWHSQLSSCK
uniref:Xylosyltransferase 1 n=1 Tax=Anthurium amnicola TaxID=1678845 RepID=A0A1D1XSS2_9ARAE